MNKLKMAHEYLLRYSGTTVADAWRYADAMQSELDKRNKDEAEQKRKEIREMMNAPNTFVEREGQHFDDVEEWQPDWSQAPDSACCWFVGGISRNRKAYWSDYIPCYKNDETQSTWSGLGMIEAPMFGYSGNWQDSLRKRP